MTSLYKYILKQKKSGRKQFAVLIDPDKFNPEVIRHANRYRIDYFFVGGSSVLRKDFLKAVSFIKKNSSIPLVLFPGDEQQISAHADALLLLTLLSGRNPEYLIGKQVKAALPLRRSKIEVISTGYIIVDNGSSASSTSRISETKGIRFNDKHLLISTAIAGEMLGCKMIYLEGGSGASNEIPPGLIRKVKENISVPLIAGGGIDSKNKAGKAWKAGADIVVVGNAIEKNINLIEEISLLPEHLNKKPR